jgi:hypothetical protein
MDILTKNCCGQGVAKELPDDATAEIAKQLAASLHAARIEEPQLRNSSDQSRR